MYIFLFILLLRGRPDVDFHPHEGAVQEDHAEAQVLEEMARAQTVEGVLGDEICIYIYIHICIYIYIYIYITELCQGGRGGPG